MPESEDQQAFVAVVVCTGGEGEDIDSGLEVFLGEAVSGEIERNSVVAKLRHVEDIIIYICHFGVKDEIIKFFSIWCDDRDITVIRKEHNVKEVV